MAYLMTMDECRAWLRSLVHRKKGQRDGLTIAMVVRYAFVPRNSLSWILYKESAHFGIERLRRLSKMRADYEAGLIDFKRVAGPGKVREFGHAKKVLFRPDRPKPRAKYQVQIGKQAPTLTPMDRPKVSASFPSLKKLLGG